MTLRVHKARDFDTLVRKLYSAHGLIRTGITHLPGTLAERHAVQRLYTITRSPTAFVATPKDYAEDRLSLNQVASVTVAEPVTLDAEAVAALQAYDRARDERDRQPQPGDVFSFKDGWTKPDRGPQ